MRTHASIIRTIVRRAKSKGYVVFAVFYKGKQIDTPNDISHSPKSIKAFDYRKLVIKPVSYVTLPHKDTI